METAAPTRSPIREVFTYLCVRDGAAAIDFSTSAFGAEEVFRITEPGATRVAHAELRFGPATIMLADEFPDLNIFSPLAFGGTGSCVHLHVDNVDRVAERALATGATMVRPPTDCSHGERQCRVRDPFGHEWLLGHHLEDGSREGRQRRPDAELRAGA